MHREGHYGVTLLLAAPLILFTNVSLALIGTGIMLLVTTFPDKDHRLQTWAENSLLLRILPGGGRIKSACRHRGVMHTFLVAGIGGFIAGVSVGFPIYLVHPDPLNIGLFTEVYATPVLISVYIMLMVTYAWVGHIIADALTVGSGRFGVKPYWPVSRKQLRFGYFKAANKWANGGFLLAGLMAFGGAMYYKIVYLGAFPFPV